LSRCNSGWFCHNHGDKHEKLDVCPVCGAKRCKITQNDNGDVNGEPTMKKIAAKVMWYFPIIPRLKRLFKNKAHTKLMLWHKEECKHDRLLRHPTNGSQWRNVDREFPDFDKDARNKRFDLSTDEMNPFDKWASSHSTWPVTLCIFNLSSLLCMKRKYIMMPMLIQAQKTLQRH
jgi:hypothetical protein